MEQAAATVEKIDLPIKTSGPSGSKGQSSFISDLIELSKPGIMVLLLISTGCPMILAAGGPVDLKLFLLTMLGGGLVSGSASTMNCIWDRDIDAIMERTKRRALPDGRVTPMQAVLFSIFTGVLGLWILNYYVNVLAASLALFGHLFYVVIYTVLLKRNTTQNIVIGGAAGAVPPLVGWAAVTGSLNSVPWLLFLVIFLWTPPHFWALALNKNSDYKRANVPMLPVVSGEVATVKQMLIYSLLLIPVSIYLVYADVELGKFSFYVLTALGLLFSYYNLLLWKAVNESEKIPSDLKSKIIETSGEPVIEADKVRLAWKVFKFSLVYLGLFFVCLVVDSTLV